MMTPRQFGGGIGPGMNAFAQQAMAAQQMRRQQEQDALQRKLFDLRLGEAAESAEERRRKRDMDAALQKAARDAYTPALPGSLGGGVTPMSQQGRMLMSQLSGDPEFDAAMLGATNSALNSVGPQQPISAPTAGGFSRQRFVNNLYGAGLAGEAMRVEDSMAKESPFGKLDPSKFTPESLAEFAQSGGRDYSLLRAVDPSKSLEFGLVPQIGRNPTTNRLEYFVQGKDARTQWLGVAPPPNLEFVPGSDYRPSMTFDRRSGTVAPTAPAGPAAQPPAPGAAPAAASESTPVEPSDPFAPWKGLPPKRADDVRIRIGEQVRRQLDEERAAVREEGGKVDAMSRFGQLNRQTRTGGVADEVLPNFLSTNDTVEMRAITARLAPRERVPGTGASSDRDVALFMAAVPSVNKPGPVNAAIRQAREAGYRRSVEYLNEKEAYFAKFGHVEGFDRIWDAYTQAAPLFSADATPENFKLNDKRPTFADWSKKGREAPAAADRVMTEADIVATVRSSGRSREDVIRAARERGFTINSPFVR
jgi:hypothetical protein